MVSRVQKRTGQIRPVFRCRPFSQPSPEIITIYGRLHSFSGQRYLMRSKYTTRARMPRESYQPQGVETERGLFLPLEVTRSPAYRIPPESVCSLDEKIALGYTRRIAYLPRKFTLATIYVLLDFHRVHGFIQGTSAYMHEFSDAFYERRG